MSSNSLITWLVLDFVLGVFVCSWGKRRVGKGDGGRERAGGERKKED